jgi:hypothetical protein
MSARRIALLVNVALISLFGVASGGFKLAGGQADLEVFKHIGMGATAVAVFGAVQLLAGAATAVPRTRRGGGALLTACNALASVGLFVAGVQPFGVISLVFVAMAVAATWLRTEAVA